MQRQRRWPGNRDDPYQPSECQDRHHPDTTAPMATKPQYVGEKLRARATCNEVRLRGLKSRGMRRKIRYGFTQGGGFFCNRCWLTQTGMPPTPIPDRRTESHGSRTHLQLPEIPLPINRPSMG
jgi:hypothetical protein